MLLVDVQLSVKINLLVTTFVIGQLKLYVQIYNVCYSVKYLNPKTKRGREQLERERVGESELELGTHSVS